MTHFKKRISLLSMVLSFGLLHAQETLEYNGFTFEAVHVRASVSAVENQGMAIKAERDLETLPIDPANMIATVDEPTFLKVLGADFKNGTLEVSVLSRLLPDAPDFARGFIGLAFRINADNSQFESIYIRPANGRAEDPERRSHAIQYFSYPDYKFARLRAEAPGEYEAYADMGLNEWIRLKITVAGTVARLYLNDNPRPALVVTDLKHGPNRSGSVGLWVEVGTEGYFKDLKITPEE